MARSSPSIGWWPSRNEMCLDINWLHMDRWSMAILICGSYACHIEGQLKKVNFKGMVWTSGTEKEVNAYWSELQGLHAAILAISTICLHHQVTSGKVMVCCNNKSALWLSSLQMTQIPLRTKNVDLLHAICKIVANLPIKVIFQDITGHLNR